MPCSSLLYGHGNITLRTIRVPRQHEVETGDQPRISVGYHRESPCDKVMHTDEATAPRVEAS